MHTAIRRRLARATCTIGMLAIVLLSMPSMLSAQRCASCVEFFICRAGMDGGITCDFLSGPCRENGSCPSIILGKVTYGWDAPVLLVLDGRPGLFRSDGDRLIPVRCDADDPPARGTVLQVGNEQYIRVVGLPVHARLSATRVPSAASRARATHAGE